MLPFQAETYNLNFYLPCFVKPLHSFSPLSLLHCLLETHHLPQFAFGLGCNTLTCPIALQDKSQVLTKYFQHKSCAHPGQNWTSQSVTFAFVRHLKQGREHPLVVDGWQGLLPTINQAHTGTRFGYSAYKKFMPPLYNFL
jgi:hypothetical protein